MREARHVEHNEGKVANAGDRMGDAIDVHDGLVNVAQVDEVVAHIMAVCGTSAIDYEVEFVGRGAANRRSHTETGREGEKIRVA